MATISATERARIGLVRPELWTLLLALNDGANSELGFTLAVPDQGGTRSTAVQEALYADSIAQGGGTLAYPVGVPGRSRHEYGAAFDVHIIRGGSNSDGTGSDDDYLQLAQLGERLGLVAGDFFDDRHVGQEDPYHFQLNETLQESIDRWNAMRKAGIGKMLAIGIAAVAAGLALAR